MRERTLAIGVIVTLLLALPAVAHATLFSTSATFDLTSPPLMASITPVTLAVGDTLSADVTFAGSQALQVGHASSEEVALFFIPTATLALLGVGLMAVAATALRRRRSPRRRTLTMAAARCLRTPPARARRAGIERPGDPPSRIPP